MPELWQRSDREHARTICRCCLFLVE